MRSNASRTAPSTSKSSTFRETGSQLAITAR
jgi:hypothetical protein